MWQTHPPQLNDVFRSVPTDSNHVKFPLSEQKCLAAAMIAQISMNLSTHKQDIVIFTMSGHTCPSNLEYLTAMELKDSRPALPDNGATEEKRGP